VVADFWAAVMPLQLTEQVFMFAVVAVAGAAMPDIVSETANIVTIVERRIISSPIGALQLG